MKCMTLQGIDRNANKLDFSGSKLPKRTPLLNAYSGAKQIGSTLIKNLAYELYVSSEKAEAKSSNHLAKQEQLRKKEQDRTINKHIHDARKLVDDLEALLEIQTTVNDQTRFSNAGKHVFNKTTIQEATLLLEKLTLISRATDSLIEARHRGSIENLERKIQTYLNLNYSIDDAKKFNPISSALKKHFQAPKIELKRILEVLGLKPKNSLSPKEIYFINTAQKMQALPEAMQIALQGLPEGKISPNAQSSQMLISDLYTDHLGFAYIWELQQSVEEMNRASALQDKFMDSPIRDFQEIFGIESYKAFGEQ